MNAEMEEELRAHIQHRGDDLERTGLSRAEAERRARIEFGGRERFKEETREAMGGSFIETVIQDVRFSLRKLRKSPGFTAVAVLTLALAIGANAIVFSVMNSLLLRPLNVPHPESLYAVWRANVNPLMSRIRTISICAIATAASRIWQRLALIGQDGIRAPIQPGPGSLFFV